MHEGSEDSRCNGPVSKLGTSQNASYKRYYSGKEGPGSSVGIATAYGLEGPGIESRWECDFPHLSRPDLRPTQPPV